MEFVRARHSSLLALSVVLAGCGIFSTKDGGGGGGGPKAGVGDPCAKDSECRDGLLCEGDVCTPGGHLAEGDDCELTASCMDGLYCDHTRTCQMAGDAGDGEACSTVADCEAGLVCVIEGFSLVCRAGGDNDIGGTCGSTLDCYAGLQCTDAGGGVRACVDPPATDGPLPPAFPTWNGADCPDESGDSPRAIFEVPGEDPGEDFYRLPFPNDVRLTATGIDMSAHPRPGDRAPIDVAGGYFDALEDGVDGFSTNPVITFRFTHEAKLSAQDVQLIDLTTQKSHSTWRYAKSSGGRISLYACPSLVIMGPTHGDPLLPGHTYAALIESTAVPADAAAGATFERSEDWVKMLGATDPGGALSAAWTKHAPLREYIEEKEVDPDTLLVGTVFTTQNTTEAVEALRTTVRAAGVPVVSDLTECDGSTTSPCDDGTEARACGEVSDAFTEWHGKFTLPNYQQGTRPYETEGGGLAYEEDDLVTQNGTTEVCFALTVPKATMPGAGWPVLVYGHGTGGSFRSAVLGGLAAEAAEGMIGDTTVRAATLTIDLPQHGARRGTSTRSPEELFYNFQNPAAARGNVLQGVADLAAVLHWVEAGTPGNGIEFDDTRVVLYGHSQGATHASLLLPFEPVVTGAVLSGNGGDLTLSMLNKSEPVDISGAVGLALLDPADPSSGDFALSSGDLHPVLAAIQTYFDSADPVNFARYLAREPIAASPRHHVLMTFGKGDHFSPEKTMEAFAYAGRMTLVKPQVVEFSFHTGADDFTPANAPLTGNKTGKTVGFRQYEPAEGDDGHFVASDTDAGRADVARFYRAILAGQTPPIGQ